MLDDLQNTLINLYPNPAEARRICQQAGIPDSFIDFSGNAQLIWHRVIIEAQRRGKLVDLVREVTEEYPQRSELQRIFGGLLYGAGRRESAVEVGDFLASDDNKLEVMYRELINIGKDVAGLKIWVSWLTGALVLAAILIAWRLF